jgi:peptidoglycan hydrolase-like protein with peptidoglycan-binding domain
VTVALAHSPKAGDPIADFLRNGDKRQLTLAAQNALAKLGFAVKPTGALDAGTRDALAEFEKTHHLPASSEITAKLIKSLNAAVAAN